MIKIIPIKITKIWGHELWIHSPYPALQTYDQFGHKTTTGPLVKIIQTTQPLSVQVHPDDQLAKQLEAAPNGKAEAWYVLAAQKTTQFVVGIKTFDPQIITTKLAQNQLLNLLVTIRPQVGTFINVPAGMVHGIGADAKVLEVQQPSDLTYRFFDYNRLQNGQPRDLHLTKALRALKDLDYQLTSTTKAYQRYDIGFYQISIFTDQNRAQFKITKKSLIVDLTNETAYYILPTEKVPFTWFVLIEY